MGRKLYVGNLPYEVGEADLQDAVRGGRDGRHRQRHARHGHRPRARLRVRRNGTDDDAQKAISQFNEHSLGGRNLTVNEARPKPERSGGFGGGDGGSRRRSEPRW